MAQLKHIEIVNGSPVVVHIVDYIAKELNSEGEYDMILHDQALLAESKRLNDIMHAATLASTI